VNSEKYNIGDIVSVPNRSKNFSVHNHEDQKITKDVLSLFNTFLEYNIKKCSFLIVEYSKRYPYLLNLDIKIFLYLCYLDNYKKYKDFFRLLYKKYPSKESACILQLISHRIYETEGYNRYLEKDLINSISFFEESQWHKWRISGKFFLGLYSNKEDVIFDNFIQCLDIDKMAIDMDCYQDKLVYIVTWLRCKYPKESEPYVKKLYDKIEKFGLDYSNAMDCAIKFHNPKLLEKYLYGFKTSALWGYINELKKNMKYKRVCILGSTGLVGSNLYKKYSELYPACVIFNPKRSDLNLENREDVIKYFIKNKPDLVFLCAAKVGGIKANNDYKADFITINIKIQTNVIEACHLADINKIVFLGSSCIYPKNCLIPIKEEYLMTGHLEDTNDAYAIAKIAGIKMCQSYNQQYKRDYISVMPCNLYGPGDNFDSDNSHVLPALIRKIDEAKKNNIEYIKIWGTGKPMREFLYVEDLVDALIYLSENYTSSEIINIGTGDDISIHDLTNVIAKIIGYEGKIKFNTDYPDGTYRKLMDVSKIFETGWRPKIPIEEGIRKTYNYYKSNIDNKNGL